MDYPSATYRVQLNSTFTFKQLAEIIDYLKDLGVSTIYAAPITPSKKDSAHGYDVVDPAGVNPQIGTLEELRALAARLKTYDMNWLQDIVPNHMAFSSDNNRLMDVLERGRDSPYYTYFDIDWTHKDAGGKLWIPVLGNEWEICLEAGEIKMAFDEQKGFALHYYDKHFPLSVEALKDVVLFIKEKHYNQELGLVLENLIEGASSKELSLWNKHKLHYTKKIADHFFKELQEVLAAINSDKTTGAQIIQHQPYLLTHWKSSDKQMNYRRFFAINDLICLRIEDESVFEDYHSFFYQLYQEQLVQGFRLDHIDGLYHPQEYVRRLREKMGEDCYLIVEKILEYNEDLAEDWDIQGTSGYEFLSFSNRVLTDQRGAEKLRQFYHAFTQSNAAYDELVFEKKQTFLYHHMLGELENLMDLLESLQLSAGSGLDRKRIKKALGLFMAAFPIYRIYPFLFPIAEEALLFVRRALDKAYEQDGTFQEELVFLRSLFYEEEEEKGKRKMQFIMRLMQFTGPLAAKGVEDTTFYVYNPLISHNEVGDAPSELASTLEEFHLKMISRKKNNPYSLNNSSTHDTKRGEDARTRINVLSHLSHEWEAAVMQWHQENEKFTRPAGKRTAPSLNDEYYIYQSLLGSFPESLRVDEVFLERTKQFMLKALREAKVETTYTQPDNEYEEACLQFITAILSAEHSFLDSFLPFLEKVMGYGSIYSLSQAVIKMTAPGIPDIYQGSELWELSYVDPDNRRTIDYDHRKSLLKEIKSYRQEDHFFEWLREKRTSGAEKLFVTATLLQFRKENNKLFLEGDYIPLHVSGPENLCLAYLRKNGDRQVMVLLPIGFDLEETGNFKTSWENVWVELPDGTATEWTNVFTRKSISLNKTTCLGGMFDAFPVAVYSNV